MTEPPTSDFSSLHMLQLSSRANSSNLINNAVFPGQTPTFDRSEPEVFEYISGCTTRAKESVMYGTLTVCWVSFGCPSSSRGLEVERPA